MRPCSNTRRGNDFKLKDDMLRSNIGIFFAVRVVRPWKKLPREIVDAPSREVLKVRLVGALSNLV